MKMSAAKFEVFQQLLGTAVNARFTIGKTMTCIAFGIQNQLRVYYFDF